MEEETLLAKLKFTLKDIPTHIQESGKTVLYLQVQDSLLQLQREHPYFTNLPKNIQESPIELQHNYLQQVLTSFQGTQKCNLVIIGEDKEDNSAIVQRFLEFFPNNNDVVIENIPKIQFSEGIDIYLYQPLNSEVIYQIFVYQMINLELQFLLSHAIYMILFDTSQIINVDRLANLIHLINSYDCSSLIYLIGTHLDIPSAVTNMKGSARRIEDIVENIQFISREKNQIVQKRSLQQHIKEGEHLRSSYVWPVSDSKYLNQLLESVVSLLNNSLFGIIPPLWFEIRSKLFPNLLSSMDEKDAYNSIKNVDLLHSAHMCGFFSQKDLSMFIDESVENTGNFIQFEVSIGDIIYYKDESNIQNSLIILKPKLLISMIHKFKSMQSDLPSHIEYASNLFQIPRKCIPQLTQQQSKYITKNFFLSALKMREALFPVSPKLYLFPSRIQSSSLMTKFANDILKLRQIPALKLGNLKIIERSYEVLYTPRISIYHFLAEIWRQLKYYPEFQRNLLNENLFWENGVILSDTSFDEFDNMNDTICVLQWQYLQNHTSITITLSEKANLSIERFLVPIIHRSIFNCIISSLNFEAGVNQVNIICKVSSADNKESSSYNYEYCYKRLQGMNSIVPQEIGLYPPIALLSQLIPEYYEQLDDSSHLDITMIKVIKSGTNFEIFSGTWNYQDVIGKSAINPEIIPSLIHEISILRTINHPNIIRILDISANPPPISIITKYYQLENLKNLLENNIQLHTVVVCTIIRDICQAVSYLHSLFPSILHCDIRPSNILISSISTDKEQVCAILCNFGESRIANPLTATSGSMSKVKDIYGVIQIIAQLESYLKNSTVDKYRQQGLVELGEILFLDSVKSYSIDLQEIASQLSENIITPYYEIPNVLNQNMDIMIYNNKNSPISKIVNSQINEIQVNEFVLNSCISELRNSIRVDWANKCRKVIPLFGQAIEQNLFTLEHLDELIYMEFNFDPEGDYIHKTNLLHYACKCANFKLVTALFEKTSFAAQTVNNLTHLPSKSAAIHLVMSSERHPCNLEGLDGTLCTLNSLIKNGADINLQDGKGETALIKAAYAGSISLVSNLLNYKSIDVNVCSNEKITAIIAAARGFSDNHQNCIDLLLQVGSVYSSYLQIGKDELSKIQSVVANLIAEKHSFHCRILRSMQSWDKENDIIGRDTLEARRVKILLQKLQITDNIQLPLQLSIKQLRKYLQQVSLMSTKLQVKIPKDIPLHALQNASILEHLQVLELLQVLEISFDQLPLIFSKDTKGQLLYLKDLKNGMQSTQKINLMVVGEEGVGKTTLVRKLVSDSKWTGSSINIKLRKGITDGIDIHVLKPDGKDFVLNIYDFAGQEIYYSTHQLVLSSKAIYLLMFNASENINANRIAHWIHTLSDIAPSAAVFILGTHFDNQKALQLLPQNLKDIRSIINNIFQINRKRARLDIIPPSHFQFPIPEPIAAIVSSVPNYIMDEILTFPIWPVSLSTEKSNYQTQLFDLLLTYIKGSLPTVVVPASWLTLRSFLIPQTFNNLDKFQKKVREKLHSQPSFAVGILYYHEIAKYAKELVDLEDPSQFIDLLESWGDIIYVRKPRDKLKSLIVIKPSILIELCKTFITAKLLGNDDDSKSKWLKKLFYKYVHPHHLSVSDLESKLSKLLPKINTQQARELVRKLVIPVLIGLHLIYPFNAIDIYLVPAMLRKVKPSLDIIKFERHPLRPEFRTKESGQIIIMKRKYEFVYLPSGLFTRLMLQIWEYFSNFREYSVNLLNEKLFWEDGFIISDSPTPTTQLNYYKHDIGIISCINSEGTARAISVRISCPKSKATNILPFVHKTINTYIQFLEFGNRTKIFCFAFGVDLPSQYLKYEDCFPSAKSNPQISMEYLTYLVPEYYLAKFDSPNSITNHSYNDEVEEVKTIGHGASGIVFLGYWHSKRVAIKKLKPETPSSEVSVLLHEISLLRSVHHRNVIGHLDVYQNPIAIIMEFCEVGDLEETLRCTNIHPIVICCIIRDICQGLSYLHNLDPPIIHCDIRQGNIFLKSLDITAITIAVVGDIGAARIADQNRIAGDKSWKDDLEGIADTVTILLSHLIESGHRDLDIGNYKQSIIDKLNSIIFELQNLNINIYYDPIQIANSLSEDIIVPFLTQYNNFKYNELSLVEENVFNQHPAFQKFQKIYQRFQSLKNNENNNNNNIIIILQNENEEHFPSILKDCIELLQIEKPSIPTQEYWHSLCRYLIPIIGYAAENYLLQNAIILELGRLDFYDHPAGDFSYQMRIFQYACLSANILVVERFLPLSLDHNTTFCGYSQSAIHLAVNSISHPKNRDGVDATLRVIDVLMKYGADINLQDGKGETALIIAARIGSVQLVVHLLNYKGIDVNINSDEKITAIIAAARGTSNEHQNCIKVLLQRGSECSSYLSIQKQELQRIQRVAADLIEDKHSIYGRCSHATVVIQSWKNFRYNK